MISYVSSPLSKSNTGNKNVKSKCLLFVESPGKCNTIKKYLNEDKENEYEVIATIGHIKQLPSKNGSILFENGEIKFLWEDKGDSVLKLKNVIKNNQYDKYYIATDQDREGEGISYHVYTVLKEMNVTGEIHRVTFNEITKKAVQSSLKQPRNINQNLVNAFLSRLAIDYLIGYTLSPLTWKFGSNYSVGRVQSSGVKMIIEREKEIFDFIQTTYYMIEGIFKDYDFKPKLIEYKNEDVKKIQDEKYSEEIVTNLLLPENQEYFISEIIEKDMKKGPSAPFTTDTLQQEAVSKLGFTVNSTMRYAQKIYESGLITYMRTDSTVISDDFVLEIRKFINNEYGKEYLSEEVLDYKNKVKTSQEAHEAIRPTDITKIGNDIEDPGEKALYQMIWRKTVACQMSQSLYKKKDIVIKNKNNLSTMLLQGSQLVFLGYLKVYGREEDEDNLLPSLNLNEKLLLKDINKTSHETKHPPRYNEGSLVKQLKKKGIGRPSTYGLIIEILKKREYVHVYDKSLVGVMKGKILIAFLESFFSKYVDYDFTANMEEKLDDIANGQIDWKTTLNEFYENLRKDYSNVHGISLFDILKKMNHPLQEWNRNKKCEKCGSIFNLYIKSGLFLCCSNKECNSTAPLRDELKGIVKKEKTNKEGEETEEGGEKKKFFKKTWSKGKTKTTISKNLKEKKTIKEKKDKKK